MRSLRLRLVLGVVLVLAVVGAVAGVGVSRFVERSERAALDDRLERTAELSRATARAAVQEGLPEQDGRLDAVLSATGTSLRLVFAEEVLLEAGRPPAGRRPAPRLGFRTVEAAGGAGGERFRTFATTLRDPSLGGLAVLEVTSSLRGLERRQRALDRRLLSLGLIALLVAAVGAGLAAELVLRPLRRLRRLASGIVGDEDLNRRMPLRGPQEVRSLAESFNAMLARLSRSASERERALAATRRFTADAGHELRTPLTSVLTALSALSRHPHMTDEQRAGLVGSALEEHARLMALLDGLQALARGEASAVAFADVDLVEVADSAASAFVERFPTAALDISLPDEPVAVRGWEPGLRLVLDNLLANAARHGASRVSLRVAAGGSVSVEDDGPGVPPADCDRIFEPFARLSPEGGGSGLGLALVAQQVEHHGGTVVVSDSPLGGAAFSVRLPAAPPAPRLSSTGPAGVAQSVRAAES